MQTVIDHKNMDNEVIDIALQRIVAEYQPEKVVMFGSYAYGEPDSESDLDLLIIKQTSERPIDRRVRVRTLLRPLKLRPAVSPIVVTQDEIDERLSMGDPFAKEIMGQGKVIYER